MKTVISSKGQIVLPAALRRQDGIKAGQQFDIQRVDQGEYLLKRATRAGAMRAWWNFCLPVPLTAGSNPRIGPKRPTTFLCLNWDDLSG